MVKSIELKWVYIKKYIAIFFFVYQALIGPPSSVENTAFAHRHADMHVHVCFLNKCTYLQCNYGVVIRKSPLNITLNQIFVYLFLNLDLVVCLFFCRLITAKLSRLNTRHIPIYTQTYIYMYIIFSSCNINSWRWRRRHFTRWLSAWLGGRQRWVVGVFIVETQHFLCLALCLAFIVRILR